MLRRLRSHLSFANIVSVAALFVALGGTGYAAISLPRNSVGSAQIRNRAITSSDLRTGAVTSRALHNRTIRLGDLSPSARTALRGATGPQGPAGPAGPTYSAAVPSGGSVQRGNAVSAAHQGGTNEYRVTFPTDVSKCVAAATLAAVPSGPSVDQPQAGRITVTQDQATSVLVKTYDINGAPAEQPFNVVLAC